MAVTIAPELLEFKSKVGGSISGMMTTATSLSSKLSSLSSLVNSTSSSFSSMYDSKNKDTVLSKFTQISDVYTKISSSVENDLMLILNNCNSLLEKIAKLEKLKQEIDDLEAVIAAAKASMQSCSSNAMPWERWRVEEHNRKQQKIIDEKTAELNIKTSEFNRIHEEAKSELNKLKEMDSSISFVSEFSSTSSNIDVNALSQYRVGKDFIHKKYTASNGQVIDYFLYVPKYSTDVTGLPVHLYLHSAGCFNSDATTRESLPMYLKNGTVKANGIVICPQATTNMDHWRYPKYEEALIELTNTIVEEYKADSSRISLSGYSRGAQDGYKYVADNPGYFSAFIPVAGHSGAVKAEDVAGLNSLGNTKIWAFHGKEDPVVKYAGAVVAKRRLNDLGYNNMTLHTFEDEDHMGIEDRVYKNNSYEYSDGSVYNPLEWAFSQTTNV